MRNGRVLMGLCGVIGLCTLVQAGEHSLLRGHKSSPEQRQLVSGALDSCRMEKMGTTGSTSGQEVSPSQFEGIQIETSDIALYEKFFETILHADPVEKIDHPEKDSIRGYCYRHVRIVIRQDFQHPRPTGWVQINFDVPDAQSIHDVLRKASEELLAPGMSEAERYKVVRLKLKPEVTRGHRKAIRLEVYGPEGFLIGFDQYLSVQ